MYPLLLQPAFKDYLWGGQRLKAEYNKNCELNPLAESWEVSCHADGESVISNGEYAGLNLSGFLAQNPAALGFKRKQNILPLLIKLLDSKQSLSVQVHPGNKYAKKHLNDSGKTEMWYVLDCEPNSYIYLGFKKRTSKKKFEDSIEKGTLTDLLNKITVKKGDVFFIPAGTIHALGAGIVIAEVQQSSNATFRVYDFGRTGADGRPRQLHIKQALDVTKRTPAKLNPPKGNLLAECKYFKCGLLNIEGQKTLNTKNESFHALLCTQGTAEVTADGITVELKRGQSCFITADTGAYTVCGNGAILITQL